MTVITQLPDPPSRTTPSQFSARTDAFLGALPGFVTETNAVASEVNADKTTAVNSAAIAVTKAAEATASASTAAIVGTSTKWVSGTIYTEGQGVWSPADLLPYRRLTNGAGTLDPSVDSGNWEPLPPVPMVRVERSSNVEITPADRGHFFDITSGTFSQTFSSKEILGNGFYCYILNSGAGVVTIDPGGLNYALYKKHSLLIHCDGTSLRVVVDSGPRQVRLPIFSEATVGLEAASALENIDGELVDTGLTGGTGIYVVYDQVEEVFIASIATGNKIATSPDGITWTLRTMPSSAQWYIVPGPGGWFAYTKGGTATAFSDNAGVSWTSRTAVPFTPQYAAILGGRILLVQTNSAGGAYTDNYGTSWTTVTLPSNTGPIGSVGGLFAMTPGTPGVYYTSPTGGTGSWTLRNYPDADIYYFRTSSVSGNLIASIANSTLIAPLYQTTDGISWSEIGDFFGGAQSIMGPINEVYVVFASVLGACASFHKPGVPALRASGWDGVGHSNSAFDGVSTHVYGGTSSGLVMVIDETTYSKTGLFEV